MSHYIQTFHCDFDKGYVQVVSVEASAHGYLHSSPITTVSAYTMHLYTLMSAEIILPNLQSL